MRNFRAAIILWAFVVVSAVFGLSVLHPPFGEMLSEIVRKIDGVAAVTAAATIAIAWFTSTLQKSTDKMWLASTEQLAHSKDASAKQLRAYISHQPHGAHYDGEHLAYYEKNFGATPAKDVEMFICIIDGPDPPQTFGGPFTKLKVMSYVAPGQNIGKLIPGYQGKTAFFLYGCIDYTDIFERKWRRRYAFSYDASRADRKDDQWWAHHEHNDEHERVMRLR
jgi:hypothetical protein